MARRKNPILIKFNKPDEDVETQKLWQQSQAIRPDMTRQEFDDGLKQFLAQHHIMPDNIRKVDIPGLDPEIKIMVSLGKTKEIGYYPDFSSRKAPHEYVHKTKDEFLATDASGKTLIYGGKTIVKSDGWLHF